MTDRQSPPDAAPGERIPFSLLTNPQARDIRAVLTGVLGQWTGNREGAPSSAFDGAAATDRHSNRLTAVRIAALARLRRQGAPAMLVSGCVSGRAIYCQLLTVPPAAIAIGPGIAISIRRPLSQTANTNFASVRTGL